MIFYKIKIKKRSGKIENEIFNKIIDAKRKFKSILFNKEINKNLESIKLIKQKDNEEEVIEEINL